MLANWCVWLVKHKLKFVIYAMFYIAVPFCFLLEMAYGIKEGFVRAKWGCREAISDLEDAINRERQKKYDKR